MEERGGVLLLETSVSCSAVCMQLAHKFVLFLFACCCSSLHVNVLPYFLFLEISAKRLNGETRLLDITLNCLSLLCTSEQYETSVGILFLCLFVYR